MADTARYKNILTTSMGDNITRAVTPQLLRDFVETVYGRYMVTITTASVYTASISDVSILVNTPSSTIVLPTATAASAGRIIDVKLVTSLTPSVIVKPITGTLDGVTSKSISYAYGSMMVIDSGSAWFTIAQPATLIKESVTVNAAVYTVTATDNVIFVNTTTCNVFLHLERRVGSAGW